ncbi:MAG: hypothetical protein MUD01_22725, partial [Chloroflexaceae bacterium]|nr:hypothetical protein [Chloroflexaceae bacterium]
LVNIGSNPGWQGTGGIQFAVNTWQTRTHPNYPAQFRIAIDTNRDGSADFEIFNQELGGFGATGQNFTFARPITSPSGTGFFFTDADLNSGNAILTVPLSLIGLTPTSQFNFTVSAVDNYFTGAVKSQISNMTFTPATPRFVANGGLGAGTLAPASSAALNVTAVAGGAEASPSQSGLLLLYRNKAAGSEAEAISVTP